MSIYLGIDIGTSGTKTLAINEQGKILARRWPTYPCYHPKPLWSEQDPEDWWQATVKTVRAVVKQGEAQAGRREGDRPVGPDARLGVSRQERTKSIRRALLWNDQRTAAECDEIEQRAGGRKKLINMVANPALTGFTAPKILWLRNHEPKNFDKTGKVLLPKDDIRRRLTGEFATEVSDASGMLLLTWPSATGRSELLGKLELDRSLLGHVLRIGRSHRQAHASRRPSCWACRPIAWSSAGRAIARRGGRQRHRQPRACSPRRSAPPASCSSTATTCKSIPLGRLHTFCHAVHGKWHMMGVSLSAGGSLQWFRNAAVPGRHRPRPRRARSTSTTCSPTKPAVTPPGSEGLFFLPYLVRRAHAARRSRRPRLLRRPDARPHPRPHGPRDHGRRHLLACATAWRSSRSWACR